MKSAKKSTNKSASKDHSANKSIEKKVNLKELLSRQMLKIDNSLPNESTNKLKAATRGSVEEIFQFQDENRLISSLKSVILNEKEIDRIDKKKVQQALKKLCQAFQKENLTNENKIICLTWIENILKIHKDINNDILKQFITKNIENQTSNVQLLEISGKLELLQN